LTAEDGANGIPAEIADQPEGHSSRSADLIRIGLVALCALAGKLGASEPLFQFDVFSLLGALLGGYPILQEAAKALRRRRMTMELSMSIAVLAAIAIGQYFTAAIIVLFVLGAEVLEDMTVSRGNRALSDLVPLLPDTALLRERTGTRKVPVSQLRTAHLGCIVREGKTLEQLARIDTVVLDKTGTLTLGAPAVVGIHPVAGSPPRRCSCPPRRRRGRRSNTTRGTPVRPPSSRTRTAIRSKGTRTGSMESEYRTSCIRHSSS
jgi:cation transport ATPase